MDGTCPHPNPVGQISVSLTGVSCVGSTWCMAAGSGQRRHRVPDAVRGVERRLHGTSCRARTPARTATTCRASTASARRPARPSVTRHRRPAARRVTGVGRRGLDARHHAEPDGSDGHELTASPVSPTGSAWRRASRIAGTPSPFVITAPRSLARATASSPPTAASSPTGAARRSWGPWAAQPLNSPDRRHGGHAGR